MGMTQRTETRFQPGDTITDIINPGSRYTVLVAEPSTNGNIVASTSEGHYFFFSESRCEAVRDPLPSGYLNLYANGTTGPLHKTRADADRSVYESGVRVAVIHIDETGHISIEDIR